jgi:hypothetical protein
MVDNPVLMIVDKLRLRCSYGAAVFIPLGDRKWTALLAECGEICQHYFSIFETADDADNENEQDEGPRIFPALAGTHDEEQEAHETRE